MKYLFSQNRSRLGHYGKKLAQDIYLKAQPNKGLIDRRVLVNSFPKAGTHLLESLLEAIPNIHCPLHRTLRTGNHSSQYLFDKIKSVRPGMIKTAHLHYSLELEQFLINNQIVHFFVIRDPRNIIVSHIRYVLTQHTNHPESKYFSQCETKADCISLFLRGNGKIEPFESRLRKYLDWCTADSILLVKFEDIIQCIAENDIEYIGKICGHMGIQLSQADLVRVLEKFKTAGSLTYSGKNSDAWRDVYTPELADLYNKSILPIAEKIGYPKPVM